MIRAERLESLIWNEVRKVLENPGLIVAGIEALNAQEDGGGLVEEIALVERDLKRVQAEEDRAIRLYVSGKITEDQLDHQRRFITERLETLRGRLDEYRSQHTALAEKRNLMENIVAWAREDGATGWTTCPTRDVARCCSFYSTEQPSTATTTSKSRWQCQSMILSRLNHRYQGPRVGLVDEDGMDAGLAPELSLWAKDALAVEGPGDVRHSAAGLGKVEDALDHARGIRVGLQGGALLRPVLHHHPVVAEGGVAGDPEAARGGLPHPPRDLLGQVLAVEFVHALDDGLHELAGGGVVGVLGDGDDP